MSTDALTAIKRILVYKRTHNGDPNEDGNFGCNDCMRSVRDRDFDAVIGVGGISWEPRQYEIDGKINWIGIMPVESDTECEARMQRRKKRAKRKTNANGVSGRSDAREVLFQHFLAFNECGRFPDDRQPMFVDAKTGPQLEKSAPKLSKTLLRNSRPPRMLEPSDGEEFIEAMRILALAEHAPPSRGVKRSAKRSPASSCKPTKC